MLYVIWTQKSRNTAQILYDFNAEIMRDTIKPDQIKFRRVEMKIKVIFQWILGLVVVSEIASSIAEFFFYYNSAIRYRDILQVFFITVYFIAIMVSIKRYHNYEFRRIGHQTCIYYMANIVYFLTFNLDLILFSEIFDHDQPSISSFFELCLENTSFNHYKYPIFYLILQVIMLPLILFCMAIILAKSKQDILQGLNKLDYLLKVSVFQVYKDADLRSQ